MKDTKKETVTGSEIVMTNGSDASSVMRETTRRAHVTEVEGNCEIEEPHKIFNILVQRKCTKLR